MLAKLIFFGVTLPTFYKQQELESTKVQLVTRLQECLLPIGNGIPIEYLILQ
jgi:hypothetical protein